MQFFILDLESTYNWGGYRVAAIYVGIFDSIICQAYMCTDFRGSGKGVTQYGVHMYVK